MKTASPLNSYWRSHSREVIHKVIAENVHGPVQCLAAGDVLELRGKLREAYPFGAKKHWPYKCWCEEIRDALGFEVKRSRRAKKKKPLRSAATVMPSMREWAIARGIATADAP